MTLAQVQAMLAANAAEISLPNNVALAGQVAADVYAVINGYELTATQNALDVQMANAANPSGLGAPAPAGKDFFGAPGSVR